MNRRGHRKPSLALAAFLVAVFALSAAWALVIPLPSGAGARGSEFQPDEQSHIAVIRYIAERRALPPYTPTYYETMHPPLYHAGAAFVYALTEPLVGSATALLILRLLSALIGCVVVWLIYQTTRRTLGRESAWFAALLAALIPMRASASGGLSNEHLAVLGATGAFAVMAGGIRNGFTPRRIVLLLIWTGVGIGSKLTCLGLIPAAALALGWDAGTRGGGGSDSGGTPPPGRLMRLIARLAALCTVTILTLGRWLWDNKRAYGDPLRKAAIDRMWDPIQPGYRGALAERGFSPLRYLGSLFHNGWTSFWGVFDSMRLPLPPVVFALLFLFHGIVLAGLGIAGARGVFLRRRPRRALLLCWGAGALTSVAMYIVYNWSHYSPQGRYFFILLLPLAWCAALGWRCAFPARGPRRLATGLLMVFLLLVNLYALRVMPPPHLPVP